MTMPTEDGQPSVRVTSARGRELGEELRQVRKRLGIRGNTICEEVGWSQAKLSKLESGKRGTSEADVATLLGFYRTDKTTRTRILGLATEPDHGLFVRPHHDVSPDDVLCVRMHEATAQTLTCYEPLLLPSLLHSMAYTEALLDPFVSGVPLAARCHSRAARQAALHQEAGPESVFFVHETALHLVVGDARVMHDQCMRLSFTASQAQFSLRVVPMSTGHAALRHAVTLLTFAAPLKPLAYSETDTATVFFDDETAIAAVQRKFTALDRLALSIDESRGVFRRWADAYDSATGR